MQQTRWDAGKPFFQARMLGHMRTPEETVNAMLARLGRAADTATKAALAEARWSFFHTITLYDDTLPALDELGARGHPLAMVSNCSAEVWPVFDRLALRERFDALALSCDVGVAKPDPGIYLYATGQLHVAPETCVFVGDGENDEHAGAKALGMTTVWIRRPDARPREVEADHTIASLLELLALPAA
jgi:putative hydrolase of the HAD superfamily